MSEYALIIGGELRNKGAQAMTFVAVSEVRRRFPGLEPVLLSSGDLEPMLLDRIRGWRANAAAGQVSFEVAWGSDPASVDHLLGGPGRRSVKRVTRYVECGAERGPALRRLRDLYSGAALCLDVSGFAFGEKWGFRPCMDWLRRLESVERFGIPLYLMPQSFGPFSFGSPGEAAAVLETARAVLPGARIVFAREGQGLADVRALCPGAEVRPSEDIVLQSGRIDPELVLREPPAPRRFEARGRAAGIVPNARNAQHGDPGRLRRVYRGLVGHLLELGFEDVLLIRHASEDLLLCEQVKSDFPDDSRVRVLGEDLWCFEYGEVFAACELVVASRYHAIVHAYREGVPCVALGWAAKYRELLARCGQDGLAVDATSPDLSVEELVAAVDRVVTERDGLSARIISAVGRARGQSVFDQIEDDFTSLGRDASE